MREELMGKPAYTGMTFYPDTKNGFGIWIPSEWRRTDLKKKHNGALYSPYPDDNNTCILFEKHILKVKVTRDDIPVLREALHKALLDLPGVEVETTEENISDTINVFDARFTFIEDGQKRKRWLRNIYWAEGQLVVVAQGRTPEDFDYWLPMFFNTMTTIQIL